MLNRNFNDFKFQHKRNKNQILYTTRKITNDDEILNLIDNFLLEKNINKNSPNFEKMSSEEGAQSKNHILKSYDLFLNNRYQVVVNEKTLERVKNYFK